MDRVYNNDNLIDVEKMDLLVDTISYCKKFCFGEYNIYCLMNHLDDWTVVNMNVSY